MEKLDTREWLLTNGLGSFASGTVGDAHTRTYHGWLIAALEPPSRRTLLLSHIEASLEIGSTHTDFGTNYWGSGDVSPDGFRWLRSFRSAPVPTWIWGRDRWTLSRELLLPHWTSTFISEFGAPSDLGATSDIYQWLGLASSKDSPDKLHEKKLPENTPHKNPYERLNVCHRVLVRYRYQGQQPATLTLRPLIGDRYFHHQQRASSKFQFSQVVTDQQLLLQAIQPDWSGTPWYLRWTHGAYHPDSVWYWDYCYPEETRRGLADAEDLYSPGYIRVTLQPGDAITLDAHVGLSSGAMPPLTPHSFDECASVERDRLQNELRGAKGGVPHDTPIALPGCVVTASDRFPTLTAAEAVPTEPSLSSSLPPSPNLASNDLPSSVAGEDSISSSDLYILLLYMGEQFITHRTSVMGPTIMAGYPWFSDWGRDTLISIPGLVLTPQRFSLARGLLQALAQYCDQGLIPNTFPDKGSRPYFNSLDTSLWWIETLGLYWEATQDWDFVEEQYPMVQRMYKSLMTGTLHDIRIDAVDGLLTWNSPHLALTWMDAVVDDCPVTSRAGKAIEINALWYSCLCWMQRWATYFQHQAHEKGDEAKSAALSRQIQRYKAQITQVQASLNVFWNPRRGYFYDAISPDDSPDPSIRPNAIIALSLAHCGFSIEHGQRALDLAHDRLLTPYGLRSLDPSNPKYRGNYAGNMFNRDRAYHQGTVWSWLLGPFIRAWKRFYSDRPIPFNPDPLFAHIVQQDCLGSVSEIFDGDPPHLPQGAISQAWSIAELLRHWQDITQETDVLP